MGVMPVPPSPPRPKRQPRVSASWFLVACLVAGGVSGWLVGQGQGGDDGEGESVERVTLRSLSASGHEMVRQRYSLPPLREAEEAVDEPSPTPLPPLPSPAALPVVEESPLRETICSFDWPQGCDYWIAVAACESTLRPYAVSYGGTYIGLFQVWNAHRYDPGWLLDAYNNTLAAWELSGGGVNTWPWPNCRYQ